jgi:uncharacterized FAD-dependent dehydrogenase
MPETIDLFVPLDESEESLGPRVERALGWPRGELGSARVVLRSLDARKGRPLGHRLRIVAARRGESAERAPASSAPPRWPAGRPAPKVVVVGSGPAGSWAALRLAEAGVPVTVLEQGKPVQPRRRDLALITRGTLTPSSNYCFGEGGAGTYSDGKLYTRSKDRGGVAAVIADLIRFGAPDEIAVEARPHVGSNRLPRVLAGLREHMATLGVEHRFGASFESLRTAGGRVRAVTLVGGDELPADMVVLAVGHSARPVYDWAARSGVAIERKSIAVGVRIEHPQRVIDELQYGAAAGHPKLPAALYELTAQACGRGVYSFCMCPGGWIVPAATEPEGVVVNGMSLSRRDSPYANAGLVVSVAAEDFGPPGDGPLAGIELQRRLERAAYRVGGGGFRAPAQRLDDFLAGRPSREVGSSSYRPGLAPADLAEVLPPFVVQAMREGLRALGARMPGFLMPEALLIGVETRTSAPVRLLRDQTTLRSPGLEGLYPCGEGAGYAGGIISAALDGVRVAERILASASA